MKKQIGVLISAGAILGLTATAYADSFGLSFGVGDGGLNSVGFSYANGGVGLGVGFSDGYCGPVYQPYQPWYPYYSYYSYGYPYYPYYYYPYYSYWPSYPVYYYPPAYYPDYYWPWYGGISFGFYWGWGWGWDDDHHHHDGDHHDGDHHDGHSGDPWGGSHQDSPPPFRANDGGQGGQSPPQNDVRNPGRARTGDGATTRQSTFASQQGSTSSSRGFQSTRSTAPDAGRTGSLASTRQSTTPKSSSSSYSRVFGSPSWAQGGQRSGWSASSGRATASASSTFASRGPSSLPSTRLARSSGGTSTYQPVRSAPGWRSLNQGIDSSKASGNAGRATYSTSGGMPASRGNAPQSYRPSSYPSGPSRSAGSFAPASTTYHSPRAYTPQSSGYGSRSVGAPSYGGSSRSFSAPSSGGSYRSSSGPSFSGGRSSGFSSSPSGRSSGGGGGGGGGMSHGGGSHGGGGGGGRGGR